MTTLTPILRMTLPPFDSMPWDEAVNGNFSTLDAVVGRYLYIPNYFGIWLNNTTYPVGANVSDATDASLWQCLVAHTTPTTGEFSDERTAHPEYWTKAGLSAAEYAAQAKASAEDANASALEADSSADAAKVSEDNAADSADAADDDAAAAALSAQLAANAQGVTTDTYKQFVSTWYGASASTPATDPLGNPPTAGDAYFDTSMSALNVYSGSVWQPLPSNFSISGVVMGDNAPTGRPNGTLWWNTLDGQLYVYYDDGDSKQWVIANSVSVFGSGGGGGGGINNPVFTGVVTAPFFTATTAFQGSAYRSKTSANTEIIDFGWQLSNTNGPTLRMYGTAAAGGQAGGYAFYAADGVTRPMLLNNEYMLQLNRAPTNVDGGLLQINDTGGTATDAAVAKVVRTTTYTGGSPSHINQGYKAEINVATPTGANETGLMSLITLTDPSVTGQCVGTWSQINIAAAQTSSTTPNMFGGYFVVYDQSGRGSNVTTEAMVGIVGGIKASGPDPAHRRVAIRATMWADQATNPSDGTGGLGVHSLFQANPRPLQSGDTIPTPSRATHGFEATTVATSGPLAPQGGGGYLTNAFLSNGADYAFAATEVPFQLATVGTYSTGATTLVLTAPTLQYVQNDADAGAGNGAIITGHASIPSNTRVLSWVSSDGGQGKLFTITLSKALTGNINVQLNLTFHNTWYNALVCKGYFRNAPIDLTGVISLAADSSGDYTAVKTGGGDIVLSGGNIISDSASGDMNITKADGTQGSIRIEGGGANGGAGLGSGDIEVNGDTGIIQVYSGGIAATATTAVGSSGDVQISTGASAGAGEKSGDITLNTAPSLRGSARGSIRMTAQQIVMENECLMNVPLFMNGRGIKYANVGSTGLHDFAFGWTGSVLQAYVDGTSIGTLATSSSSATPRDLARMQAQWVGGVLVTNGTYYFVYDAPYAGTINSLKYFTSGGSFTIAVQINAANVTGLSGITVSSSTVTTTNATALNTFTAGQRITCVVTGVTGSPTDAVLSLAVTWSSTGGSLYNDGLNNAPGGVAAQYPTLLNGYATRPPWHVAGVDYGVGPPATTTYTAWTAMSGTGIDVNTTTGRVTISASNVTIDRIDFTTGSGGWLYLQGASNITITNCKFGCSGTRYSALSTGPIHQDADSSGLTVRYCIIDGASQGYVIQQQTTLIYSGGGGVITLEYNWFRNQVQHIIEVLPAANVVYRYNLCDDPKIGQATGPSDPAHMNLLQWSSGVDSVEVSFNTLRMVSGHGSEGWQFYHNVSGTMNTPKFNNNTCVVPPAGSMSYIARADEVPSGGGVGNENYFDVRGAFGAWVPTGWTGWSRSGNKNMVTGAALDS